MIWVWLNQFTEFLADQHFVCLTAMILQTRTHNFSVLPGMFPIETLNGSMRGKIDPKHFQSAFLNPI